MYYLGYLFQVSDKMALIEESVELQEINPSQVHVISLYWNQAYMHLCYCFNFLQTENTNLDE